MADLDVSQILRLGADIQRSNNRLGRDAASVVRKSAQQLKAQAQANAPRGETGDLKGSIKVLGVSGSGRGGGISATVGSELRYAGFVEFGTAEHGGPQPYMSPALDAVTPGFLEALAALSDDALG